MEVMQSYNESLEHRIGELEDELTTLQSNYEAQEIIIANLKKQNEKLQSINDNGQLQYSKLWDMYSDSKEQVELWKKNFIEG